MCQDCWAEYGSPTIDTPAVLDAVAAIGKVYMFNGAGGEMHIVLDDFNIDDDDLAFCKKWIARSKESRGQIRAEWECLDRLTRMTIEERASAISLYHGWWFTTKLDRR